jgi:hypothetical protein
MPKLIAPPTPEFNILERTVEVASADRLLVDADKVAVAARATGDLKSRKRADLINAGVGAGDTPEIRRVEAGCSHIGSAMAHLALDNSERT